MYTVIKIIFSFLFIVENDLKVLEKGVQLIKLKNGRQYERTYIIDREKMVLRYEGSTNIFRRKIPEGMYSKKFV